MEDLANRIAQRALAKRGAIYAMEIRGLLDAALEVMRACGTTSRPRVADIVAAAGLSNEAFYRHFRSKDALVAALFEDGTERLRNYVAHQMNKESTPEAKVRRWVEGVISQAAGEVAETTRAVLWNAGSLGEDAASGLRSASDPLAGLLHEPFKQLGSEAPESDASLAAHAMIGTLSDYLWRRVQPTVTDIDRITVFCLRAGAAGR
jgi:AcrR family transcriptional regulator